MKMTSIKVIHSLPPFSMHSKGSPNVRSPIKVKLYQLGMVLCIPIISKVTNSYQETMFSGPVSAALCRVFISKMTYPWIRGSCSLIAFSEKACASTRRIRLDRRLSGR